MLDKYKELNYSITEDISIDYKGIEEKTLLKIPPYTNEEIKKHYDNRIINNDRIYILEDIKRKFELYTPVSLLSKINKDKNVAIEICLLFASMFSITTIAYKNNEN